MTDTDRLARFTLAHKHEARLNEHDALGGLWTAATSDSDDDSVQASLGLPTRAEVTIADAVAGLRSIPRQRQILDLQERDLLELCMDRGGTWPGLAAELGYPSGDALRQRYRRLGGGRTWPAGRPTASHPFTVFQRVRDTKTGEEMTVGEPSAFPASRYEPVDTAAESPCDQADGAEATS